MRRQDVKKVSLKTIALIIITIFFLTISIGYSYLKQSLNILGKSTIVEQTPNKYEKGNSTYTWSIDSSWGQGGTNYMTYNIVLNIVNMDADIGSWEISFDIPNSYNAERSNVWSASSVTFKNDRITMKAQSWNRYIAKGSSLKLDFQLSFDDNQDLYIENLTLNGLLATRE